MALKFKLHITVCLLQLNNKYQTKTESTSILDMNTRGQNCCFEQLYLLFLFVLLKLAT